MWSDMTEKYHESVQTKLRFHERKTVAETDAVNTKLRFPIQIFIMGLMNDK